VSIYAGHTTMAILYGNEDYGVGFESVLNESFAGLGGEVVASEAFENGSIDIRTQLTKVKALNPDALYLITNSPASAAAALRQAKELGLTAQVYGSEAFKSDEVTDAAQEAAEGLLVTSVSEGDAVFVAAHMEKFGVEPGPFAAQAYDAFRAIFEASKTGASTGQEIKDALANVNFDGVSGPISFDGNGDISEATYDVYLFVDGAFTKQ
ncbi:MAG: ABC transporter substrate-binding protein, partial [Zetaproteobacteria bacterium]|nr:ABC transporter substrate-binding protein [Zetaproteobacteria bacterium]